MLGEGRLWSSLDLVESVGSSNTVLAERVREGTAGAGTVLVVEEQTAGRGRRDRGWVAPRYSSAMLSLVVEPTTDSAAGGWLPLISALAVTDALASTAFVEATIKWPNDVVVGESKIGGILSEVVQTANGSAVVVGMGVTVDQGAGELPSADATSVRLTGSEVDRSTLVVSCLTAWERWYRAWEGESGSAGSVMAAYEQRSSTLGRAVRAHLPDGAEVAGMARRLDDHGHLVIDIEGDEQVVAAADVVHLRPDGLSR